MPSREETIKLSERIERELTAVLVPYMKDGDRQQLAAICMAVFSITGRVIRANAAQFNRSVETEMAVAINILRDFAGPRPDDGGVSFGNAKRGD